MKLRHAMKVLIVSPCGTHPSNEGNRQRILALATQIEALGNTVHFALLPNRSFETGDINAMRSYWREKLHLLYPSTQWDAGYRWRHLAFKIVRKFFFKPLPENNPNEEVDTFYFDWWDIQLRILQYHHKFDVVIAEYVFVGRSLLAFPPSVLRVIDTHDIFNGRSQAIFAATGQKSNWLSLSEKAEVAGLKRAQRILGIQEEETDRLRLMTSLPVFTVGHLLPQRYSSHEITSQDNISTILVVGSSSSINVHGVKWLVNHIIPELIRELEHVTLRVVGGVADVVRKELGDRAGVEYVGIIEDLAAEYSKALVVVNPVQFGTGLAIKSIEALSFGKALVCTTVGARGIALSDVKESFPLVTDDPLVFASIVARLFKDEKFRIQQEQRARTFVTVWNREQVENLRTAISLH